MLPEDPQECGNLARYLERRRDVSRLTQAVAAMGPGFERQERLRDAAWALHEEATEIRLHSAAHALAAQLAARGDHQAQRALEAARRLDEAYVEDLRTLRSGVYRSAGVPLPTLNGHAFAALRQRLEEEREAGVGFARAWLRWAPRGGQAGRIAEATRASWRAAYLGEDDPLRATFATLAEPDAGAWTPPPPRGERHQQVA